MSCRMLVTRILYFGGLVTVAACSGQSPMEPSPAGATSTTALTAGAAPATTLAAVRSLPGLYTLTFHDNAGTEVASLPVLDGELILKAHVTDSAGQPAQSGSVTFEYCSLRGLPPNDITRADEAPLSECASGAARWNRLLAMPVNQSGEAGMNFGVVRIPRTVGFRFRYHGSKNGGIADGVGGPRDFEWTPQ